MGNSSSGALTKKEAEELVQARMSSYRHPCCSQYSRFFPPQQTQFSLPKIYELYEHFTSISGSISKDGLIDKAEFKKALGMKESLFVDRVFTLFDKDTSGKRAATLRSALPPAACSHGLLLHPHHSFLHGRHHQLSGIFDGLVRLLPICKP